MLRIALFSLLACFILLSSCRLKKLSAAEGPIPDMVSRNVKQTSVSPERRVEMKADRVETFNNDDYSVLFEVEVEEISNEGELKARVSVDRLEFHGSGDASAEGNARITNVEEKTVLEADRVSWIDAERNLSGSGSVKIVKENDSAVYGESFVADLAKKTYIFTDGVDGEFIVED